MIRTWCGRGGNRMPPDGSEKRPLEIPPERAGQIEIARYSHECPIKGLTSEPGWR